MLIELRVENHRSIRDEQVLTMEADRVGDADDPRPRSIEGHRKWLLPAAGVYGANASGKSNLLAALRFMRDAVIDSHRSWPPDGGVPRDPFAWGRSSLEPSAFDATFMVEGVRFQYGFVCDDDRFLEEWLHAWPRGRRQVWFERDGRRFRFGESLRGENHLVEQVTRDNALFLSAAIQLRHAQLGPVYRWFREMQAVNVPGTRHGIRGGVFDPWGERWLWHTLEMVAESGPQGSLLDEDAPDDTAVEAFIELLRSADVGIVNLKLARGNEPERHSRLRRRSRILVQHTSSAEDAWLPLDQESQGTLTLFKIGSRLLRCLRTGSLLLVDELEASLHPLLALQILKRFNDPRTNPHHAQLLFTTHDTNLLGTITGQPALRRDQVWLTEKDPEGATCLYPLTDYKPRKEENLERGYLQGRFGAIPYLGGLAPLER